ncbi:MAG: hypothetical protein JO112_14095 [Planctomycetes bacterium]|nr:hypothetical protein [Planctomycetota bacterium]
MRFTPWAALCGMLLLTQQALGQQDFVQSDGHKCGMLGDAHSDPEKALNPLKNRFDPPADDDIDGDVSLAAILSPGDDLGRFDDHKAARVAGFVINVKVGGNETCNCHATDPVDRDTHIELGLSKTAPETQRVIVEVTPRLRAKMEEQGLDWTTEGLRKAIKGKWIEVSGWLLFDTAHINEAENTNPGGDGNWRATCWEVHPITSLKVLAGPPAEMAELHPATMAAFQKAQAKQVQRDPQKAAAIRKRNQEILSKFANDELDKDHP